MHLYATKMFLLEYIMPSALFVNIYLIIDSLIWNSIFLAIKNVYNVRILGGVHEKISCLIMKQGDSVHHCFHLDSWWQKSMCDSVF